MTFSLIQQKNTYFLFVGKAKLEKIYIFTTLGDKWVIPNITKNAINLQWYKITISAQRKPI